LFVDGAFSPELPTLVGEHVVQVWRDGRWHVLWYDGSAGIPAEWLRPKPPKVVEVEKPDERWLPHVRGSAGVGFGVFDTSQMVDFPGEYLSDGGQFGGLSTFNSHGWWPIAQNGGVFWDGRVLLVLPSVRTSAGAPEFDPLPIGFVSTWVGPSVVLENIAFGLGGGVAQLQKIEGLVPRTVTLPQFHAVAGLRKERATFETGGGFSPSAAHALVRGGWGIGKPAPVSFGIGFEGDVGVGWFSQAILGLGGTQVQSGGTQRSAHILSVEAVAHFDILWGH
jgi:hypothetical protein